MILFFVSNTLRSVVVYISYVTIHIMHGSTELTVNGLFSKNSTRNIICNYWQAPSPGPVTRSRSSQSSSGIHSSPSSGSIASRGLTSPGASLDDSTETLFGAIPPTPPLVNHAQTTKPARGSAKVGTTVQKNLENTTSALGASSHNDKQPRTPQNQRILSFSHGISSK